MAKLTNLKERVHFCFEMTTPESKVILEDQSFVIMQVAVPPGKRGEIIEIVNIFRGKIVDVGEKDLVVELSGQENKVGAFIDLLRAYGIKEMARTGSIAMTRGAK